MIDKGVPYAKLALDVVEDKGDFGRYANINLSHQSKFDGIPEDEIPLVRDKIIISLAFSDAQMRVSMPEAPRESELKMINEYHKDVLGSHSSAYAWGGLLSDQILGPNSWMDLYEFGGGFLSGVRKIVTKSLSGEAIESEYSIERMLQSAKHILQVLKLGIESDFNPIFLAHSKAMVAKSFGVDISRIEEIPSNVPETAMVGSQSFRVKPALSWEGPFLHYSVTDAASSGEDSEEERGDGADDAQNSVEDMGLLNANRMINDLLADPVKLSRFQKGAISTAHEGLEELARSFPSIASDIKRESSASASLVAEMSDLLFYKPEVSVSTKEATTKTEELLQETEDLLSNIHSRNAQAFANNPENQDFIASILGNLPFGEEKETTDS